jgi:hypothetical protein
MNLLKNVKIRLVKGYQGAGTSPFTSDAIDMQGFDGCLLIGKFGTANAGNYLNAKEDDAVGLGTSADLLATKIVPSANACLAVLDIYKPCKRYLAAYATIGSSSTLEFIIAIQYSAAVLPTLNDVTDVVMSELHISPIAGTA